MLTSPMLTTTDNPYSPFTEWNAWYTYDVRMGYNTASILASLSLASGELDDLEDYMTMAEIVRFSPLENHIMVTKESFDTLQKAKLIGIDLQEELELK